MHNHRSWCTICNSNLRSAEQRRILFAQWQLREERKILRSSLLGSMLGWFGNNWKAEEKVLPHNRRTDFHEFARRWQNMTGEGKPRKKRFFIECHVMSMILGTWLMAKKNFATCISIQNMRYTQFLPIWWRIPLARCQHKKISRWRKFSWCWILSCGHGTLSTTLWKSGWDALDRRRCSY